MNIKNKQSGVTLVELAIVIVIISLIISGIMVGSDMVHNSKISTIISDAQYYKTAMAKFRTQYHSLAGDFPRATNFFVGANNGNGDGDISTHLNEAQDAWHHLSSSKIITKQYSTNCNCNSPIIETNIPKGVFKKTGFFFLYHDPRAASGNTDALIGGNFLKYAKVNSTDGESLYSAISAVDAAIIDDKVDDGMPNTGDIFGVKGEDTQECITALAAAEDTYSSTSTDLCQLWFRL